VCLRLVKDPNTRTLLADRRERLRDGLPLGAAEYAAANQVELEVVRSFEGQILENSVTETFIPGRRAGHPGPARLSRPRAAHHCLVGRKAERIARQRVGRPRVTARRRPGAEYRRHGGPRMVAPVAFSRYRIMAWLTPKCSAAPSAFQRPQAMAKAAGSQLVAAWVLPMTSTLGPIHDQRPWAPAVCMASEPSFRNLRGGWCARRERSARNSAHIAAAAIQGREGRWSLFGVTGRLISRKAEVAQASPSGFESCPKRSTSSVIFEPLTAEMRRGFFRWFPTPCHLRPSSSALRLA
jgi:hypothetical protein